MPHLKDYKREIEKLISEKNLPKAYAICNRILSYDPRNSTFIKLKIKIEKLVKSINKKAITQELSEIEHLFKNHQYAEYLKAISPLQTYVKEYPEIAEKILAAKKLLDKEYVIKRDNAYRELLKDIKNNTDDPKLTLQKLENFKKLGIHVNEVEKQIQNVKKQYVSLEIKKNQNLIKSNRYEDTLIFLLKLKKIDPKNKEIELLNKKINHLYKAFRVEGKKDFIFKTLEEVKILYITKKFEYSAELARRILDIDNKNKAALKYFNKARQKVAQESQSKVVSDIFTHYKNFRNTTDFKEKNYIKI